MGSLFKNEWRFALLGLHFRVLHSVRHTNLYTMLFSCSAAISRLWGLELALEVLHHGVIVEVKHKPFEV